MWLIVVKDISYLFVNTYWILLLFDSGEAHLATAEDARRAADALVVAYAGAFAGHTVRTPLQVLKERKKYVSCGWLLDGSRRPDSKRILRTVKDTLTSELIDVQVGLCQELFKRSIMDPILAMNVAKRYKEPMDRILDGSKPVRHFVSPISQLIIVVNQ